MRALAFVLYASIVTLMPALMVLWAQGDSAPFWLLAGDAYLYLGIGQASPGWMMSFDGIRATNGFHPLWQIWVRLVTLVGGSPLNAMALVSGGAVVLTWAGVLVLGAAIRKMTGFWVLAMLAVPGVYYLVIGQMLHNLPVWAFFDGMEAGLAFFLAALAVWLMLQPGRYLALGIVLAVLVMTRLDEVFVPLCIGLTVLAWPGSPLWQRLVRALRLSVPTVVALALYVGWSLATTGLPLPVSGMVKGEGALLANGWVTLATFVAPLIDLRSALTGYEPAREALLGGAFRVVELLVPATFAAVLAVILWRRHRGVTWAPLVIGLACGVVVKALYTFGAVHFWHQASWYFAVSMLVMTLGMAWLLAPAVRFVTQRRPRAPVWGALVLGLMTLLHASVWTSGLMSDPRRAAQRDFWVAAPTIEAALRAQDPAIRVLEFGDGMINFSFTFPVRHGFVFAGDAESLTALNEGRLLSDSVADGFDVISSYEYLRVPPGAEAWDSAQIRAFLSQSFLEDRVKVELDAFDYTMLHVDRPSGVPFIRLRPRV